jgi:hypothetical protein
MFSVPKFAGHNFNVYTVAMFVGVIVHLQTKLHTHYVDAFITYLHTKFETET